MLQSLAMNKVKNSSERLDKIDLLTYTHKHNTIKQALTSQMPPLNSALEETFFDSYSTFDPTIDDLYSYCYYKSNSN